MLDLLWKNYTFILKLKILTSSSLAAIVWKWTLSIGITCYFMSRVISPYLILYLGCFLKCIIFTVGMRSFQFYFLWLGHF